MKKSWFFPLFALISLSACQPTPLPSSEPSLPSSSEAGPNLRKGFVKTQGEYLIGDDGNPFLLRGTNLGGYLIHERWMCLTDSPDMLYTINALTDRFDRDAAFELLDIYQENFFKKEDFQNIHDLGLNCVRLPLSYLDVFDLDFALMRSDNPKPEDVLNMKMTLRKDHLQKIDQFIYDAEEAGIYVILDLHGAFGSQNGNDHSIDSRQHDWLWRQDALGEAFRELTLDLWSVLAQRYQGFKNVVAYDLLNEPAGDPNDEECVTATTGKLQWDYFDALYDEIRKIDPNHVIIMESCWGAENLPDPSQYGWENIMYEFHHYDGTTDDDGAYATYASRVDNIVSARFGIPLYMGEFCPHCSYEGWTPILDLFNRNHISWTNWTYRVRGFSEWGLYHIRTANQEGEDFPVSEIPAIARGNDSFEEIERKWGVDQRKGFSKNEELCSIIEQAAKAPISF